MNQTTSLIKIFVISFHLLLLSACVGTGTKNETVFTPKPPKESSNIKASFRIWGLGGGYRVIINGNELSYKKEIRVQNPKWVTEKITNQDILNLEAVLNSYNVSQWNRIYKSSPRIQDGTSWSLNYSSKDLTINSQGRNNYPENYGKVIDYISSVLLKGKPFR